MENIQQWHSCFVCLSVKIPRLSQGVQKSFSFRLRAKEKVKEGFPFTGSGASDTRGRTSMPLKKLTIDFSLKI